MPSVILAGTTTGTALSLTSDTSGELQIRTNNGSTTAMTLTTGGNVGVGTTSPGFPITVNSSSAQIAIQNATTGSSSADGSRFQLLGADLGIVNREAASIQLYTTDTERMRITSAGNIGIGTTSPVTISNYTVATINNATTGSAVYLQQAGADKGRFIATASDVIVDTQAAIPLIFGTNSSERMRIDSSGNVGIGTTSPTYKLSVNGSVAIGTSLDINPTGGNPNITMRDSNTFRGYIEANSGGMLFGTGAGATERMRIDSNGNVGIGAAASGYGASRLAVVGGELGLSNTTDARFYLYTGATVRGLLYADATRVQLEASGTNPVTLWAGSGERVRVNSDGQLLVNTTSWNGGSTVGFQVNATGTTSGAYAQLIKNGSGTEIFQMRCDGGLGNFSANNANLSDERVKTDIKLAGSYLDKICAIPVKTFKYKEQTDDLLNLGVIAQDVEAVAPELVDVGGFGETPEDGIPLKAIYQTDLQYALMKCIQEQQTLINNLTTRLNALEGK